MTKDQVPAMAVDNDGRLDKRITTKTTMENTIVTSNDSDDDEYMADHTKGTNTTGTTSLQHAAMRIKTTANSTKVSTSAAQSHHTNGNYTNNQVTLSLNMAKVDKSPVAVAAARNTQTAAASHGMIPNGGRGPWWRTWWYAST